MKKQLLVLSALFVVSATQCSYFERAKAAAREKYASAKEGFESAKAGFAKVKASADKYLPTVQEKINPYLSAIKGAMRDPVAKYLDEAMKFAAEKGAAAGVPESIIDKGKDVVKQGYISQFGETPKDLATGEELVQ